MHSICKFFFIYAISVCAALVSFQSCMKWDYTTVEELTSSDHGLFIVNEGNFQYGNATLSFYDPATNRIENEVFLRANGFKLGDLAQSMTVHDGIGWIVVNHSHVVFAIDTDTFHEVGRIENLPSPRYIHFISGKKAYITQLWDNRIFIVDPSRYEITGYITVPGMAMESGSTEQMVQYGKYIYVNCWSYQNRIIKIDTETDKVVDSLTVGIQPTSIALDCNGKLWTATDGGFEGSPYGYEPPALYKIDAESLTIERSWSFQFGESLTELQTDAAGSTLYWINDDIWRMDVDADDIPSRPFLPSRGTIYYGLTVSPYNCDIYIADAVDYQQSGKIYRYDSGGHLVDEFYTGIIPGSFAWK